MILNVPRTGDNIYYDRCCAKREIRFKAASSAKVQRDEKINGNQKILFRNRYGDPYLFAKIRL